MLSVCAIKNYKIKWGKFGKTFFLWILGISINMIPIFLKQVCNIAGNPFPGIINLAKMTLADFDIFFVNISAMFVLCIEGIFWDDGMAQWYKILRIIPFLCLVGFLVVYCVLYFNPEWFSNMQQSEQIRYNVFIGILTIVFGLLYNVAISVEKGGST